MGVMAGRAARARWSLGGGRLVGSSAILPPPRPTFRHPRRAHSFGGGVVPVSGRESRKQCIIVFSLSLSLSLSLSCRLFGISRAHSLCKRAKVYI